LVAGEIHHSRRDPKRIPRREKKNLVMVEKKRRNSAQKAGQGGFTNQPNQTDFFSEG